MKLFNLSFLLLGFFLIFSCSSEDDSTSNPQDPTYDFSISRSIVNIMELDNVTFILENPDNAYVSNVSWYLNGVQIENDFYYEHYFVNPGNYSLKAEIQYYSQENQAQTQVKTVESNFTVAERPKYLVQIKKVEISSYSAMGQFYISGLGYFMRTKFSFYELDEFGISQTVYLSEENSQNWGGSYSFPVIWDISQANYFAKVYKEGNYFPNDQSSYNTELYFSAAKRLGSGYPAPYEFLSRIYVNLNFYREIRPEVITLSAYGLEVKLTVEWTE